MNIEEYSRKLKEYIYENSSGMIREPEGCLKFPYIVPCTPDSPYYSTTLWDWDSWLTSIMMGQIGADQKSRGAFIEYEKGSVLNFLSLCTDDGYMPICVTAEGKMIGHTNEALKEENNMHKPVLAQQIAALCQRDFGKADWVQPYFPKLEAFLNRYLTKHRHETGLLYWQDDFAVGVDNDPSVFYRPAGSCGSIYLNCLMVRELLAMGYLYEQTGDMIRANGWRKKADDLTKAIQTYCWDERDGNFYSVDLNFVPVDPTDWLHQGAPRDYSCMIMRIDNWSSFMPLWAGIATPEQAERMLEHIRDKRTYSCKAGIRTLSRLEKMYDIKATNNPSNWRGPVWGISNFLVFSGMLKYGFEEDAREMAEKTICLFGRDLEINGCLHEYYHPDTGMPIVTHNFQNWNFLVLNMIAWMEGRQFMDTY